MYSVWHCMRIACGEPLSNSESKKRDHNELLNFKIIDLNEESLSDGGDEN